MFSKILTFIVLISGFVCGPILGQKKKKSIAEAPNAQYNYTPSQVTMQRFLSTMNVGLNVPISEIEHQINAQLNGLIYEDNSYTDNKNDGLMAKVWKRDNIIMSEQGQALGYKVPLKVWTKISYSALGLSTEKEIEFDLNISLKSTFKIGPSWSFLSKTELVQYEFVTSPKVSLGPVAIPVTPLVKNALDKNMPSILAGLDKSIQEKIDLNKTILSTWNTLATPLQLSEKYKTWLKISPIELQVAPLTLKSNQFHTTIGLKAYTETTTGLKPQGTVYASIPAPKESVLTENNFNIGIISQVSYEDAAQIAKDTLIGQVFEFQNGKYKIKLNDIDIYGNNQNLIIKTDLSGSLDGTIYFKGIPYYDLPTRSIKLKDFDFELKTKNLLAKAASWLLAGTLSKNMQDAIAIPCGTIIDETKNQLNPYFTGKAQMMKGISTPGKITSIAPDQIYLTEQAIYIRTLATGQLSLNVKGL
jgi:hypothetical protein